MAIEIRRIEVQRQPQANSSQYPILKKAIIKKGLAEWLHQCVCLESVKP
jgi:hypothetical protein